MTEWHPDGEALERFLDDALTEEESRVLQRHLFTCPDCEERLLAILPPLEDAGADPLTDPLEAESRPSPGLVQRVLAETGSDIERRQARVAGERARAAELWREIRTYSQDQRRALILTEPRYRTWGFFEVLVDKSRQAAVTEPQKAEEMARLAIELTDFLDPRLYGPGSFEAAKARAWAYLGNALRILADFRQAEQAFQTAETYLAQSWLDPLDEGLLLELKAGLRRAQRRLDEGIALLDAAIDLYREINEPHLQGRATLRKGTLLQYKGEYDAACDCFRSSLFLIDGAQEPRLISVTQFNLIYCLHDSGRTEEAAALLPDTRQIMEQGGLGSDLIRLRWLEGKVGAALGHSAAAEQALLEARSGMIEDGAVFDAALISLDLAALYARERRASASKRLIEEIVPIFSSCEVYDEAVAALIVFQKAVEMEQVTLSLVEEVASFLQESRSNPMLRFRESERE